MLPIEIGQRSAVRVNPAVATLRKGCARVRRQLAASSGGGTDGRDRSPQGTAATAIRRSVDCRRTTRDDSPARIRGCGQSSIGGKSFVLHGQPPVHAAVWSSSAFATLCFVAQHLFGSGSDRDAQHFFLAVVIARLLQQHRPAALDSAEQRQALAVDPAAGRNPNPLGSPRFIVRYIARTVTRRIRTGVSPLQAVATIRARFARRVCNRTANAEDMGFTQRLTEFKEFIDLTTPPSPCNLPESNSLFWQCKLLTIG